MIKRKLMFGITIIMIIGVSLLGCANQQSKKAVNEISTKIPIISAGPSKTEQTLQPTEAPSENNPTDISNNSVLEAYKAVLQKKAEFFSIDNKKKLYFVFKHLNVIGR